MTAAVDAREEPAGLRGSQPARDRPVLEVSGGPGRVGLDSLRELWQFRDVLGAFALRHVKVRYKQAAVGIGWAVLQPVATALLFAVFLGRLAHVPSEGVSYVVFALAGMACWTYFASASTGAMESLVTEQTLLRKVYFPREVLPLAVVLAALVDLAPALATAGIAAAIAGISPSLAWLALPLPLSLLVLLALALGLGLSALNVYYRDVRYVLPFAIQLGLFASPVVFPLSVVPERWRTLYSIADPVAPAIDGVRRIVIHQTWPDVPVTLAALAWTLVLVAAGYTLFKRLERGFSDRV